MLAGFRSFSTVRVHVCLGCPRGCFQSAGGPRIAVQPLDWIFMNEMSFLLYYIYIYIFNFSIVSALEMSYDNALYKSILHYITIYITLHCALLCLEVVRRSDEEAVLLCSVTSESSEITSKTEVRSTNFVACGTAWTTWSCVGDLMPG